MKMLKAIYPYLIVITLGFIVLTSVSDDTCLNNEYPSEPETYLEKEIIKGEIENDILF